jgi:FkbM family methyltransferase
MHDNGRAVQYDMTLDEGFVADKQMLFYYNQRWCEPETVRFMLRALREGDVAVDAGANVGFFTVLMAKLVGPTGKVIAYEPAGNNVRKLERNVKLNCLGNVTLHPQPLWSSEAEVTLHLSADSGANALAPNSNTLGAQVMRSMTLSELTQMPRLIKLDVEGAEEHVLRGAGDFLQVIPYIVCELNQDALVTFDCSQASLRRYMSLQGRDCFILHDDGALPTLVPPETVITSKWANNNVLFSTLDDVGALWPEVAIVKANI